MNTAAAPGFLRQTRVVIPARDEAASVGATVERWLAAGVGAVRVVDNGSSDATARIAARAGAEVVSEPQRGYGAAAWRGLQDWPATTPWVLFSAADGSDRLSPDEAVAWQHAVEAGAALVMGDRMTLANSRVHLEWTQRWGHHVVCGAIRLGWGRRFHDLGSLRLARRDSLVQLGLRDRGFGWNVEMQVRALEAGWKIVELPVRYFPRTGGVSKISGTVRGTVGAGAGIVRMVCWLWRLRMRRRAAVLSTGAKDVRLPGTFRNSRLPTRSPLPEPADLP